MFSFIQRTQKVGNQLLTCLVVLCCAISISAYIQLWFNGFNHVACSIDILKGVTTVSSVRRHGGSARQPKENHKIQFALDTDLSPLFTWNTKQVFIYLTATYQGVTDPQFESSEVVFWDKIIQDKSDAIVNLQKVTGKYPVWDYYPGFQNRTSSLQLKYNIQPYVGPLIWGSLDVDYPYMLASAK